MLFLRVRNVFDRLNNGYILTFVILAALLPATTLPGFRQKLRYLVTQKSRSIFEWLKRSSFLFDDEVSKIMCGIVQVEKQQTRVQESASAFGETQKSRSIVPTRHWHRSLPPWNVTLKFLMSLAMTFQFLAGHISLA